ncbi:MAG: SCP2 sterol-binding domain-containing protein [Promethearchaeota archaeon]
MGAASENLTEITKRMNKIPKALQVFVTDIDGKPVNWSMTFQFNMDNEDPFYLEIKDQQVSVNSGTLEDAGIVISGDNNSIIKICQGKGDFTHAISREEIKVEVGKVMDVIRLTRAITIVLKTE